MCKFILSFHSLLISGLFRLVAPFLTLTPHLCMVIEDDGYLEEDNSEVDGVDPDAEKSDIKINSMLKYNFSKTVFLIQDQSLYFSLIILQMLNQKS